MDGESGGGQQQLYPKPYGAQREDNAALVNSRLPFIYGVGKAGWPGAQRLSV